MPCVSPRGSLCPSVPRCRASRPWYRLCPARAAALCPGPRPRALPGGAAAPAPFFMPLTFTPVPVPDPRCPCPRVPISSPVCVLVPRHTPCPHAALSPTAAKSKGKGVPKEALKGPEVCTDPTMLATHAMGVNYFKEGPEVTLKPDSEYPDWLFKIHLGPPKKLEELDPDTLEYWRRLRKYNTWQRNRLKKGKKL
ncbi:hypothetical protein Nmel_018202 [Mimus melanotis]